MGFSAINKKAEVKKYDTLQFVTQKPASFLSAYYDTYTMPF